MDAYTQGYLDKLAEFQKQALKFKSSKGGIPSEKEMNGLHNFLAQYGVGHKSFPKDIRIREASR